MGHRGASGMGDFLGVKAGGAGQFSEDCRYWRIMSKGLVLTQSLKALVEDAKSIGVSPEEVRRIQKVVQGRHVPADVRAVDVSFDVDWTGAPIAKIKFLVEDDLDPSDEKIARWNKLTTSVRRDLLKGNPPYWPSVGVRAAP
jgi:hypothetical protein